MKILFVASECAPFVKTGGLADVIGALPKALAALGVNVKIVLPLYPDLQKIAKGGKSVLKLKKLHGGPARVIAVQAEGLDLLLLDAPHLYDRPGNIYTGPDGNDWPDNHLRFGALAQIGAQIGQGGIKGWRPDVVHSHDWQAGLVPAYLRQTKGATVKTVLTIHNIAFQGVFGAKTCKELGLAQNMFTPEGMEYYGDLGFLKAAIAYSDKITTVSPTYARELMLPEFGMGLEGLLQARGSDLVGILNGIDLDAWNPETDASLPATYSAKSLKGKAKNRAAIEARFNLVPNPDAPIFCVISRLTSQKGLDLLLEVLPWLVGRGARLALLGTGDKAFEAGFVNAAREYAGSVGVIIGYNEQLSHLLQGGSDAILIPSRFEPCGLTQLYGLRYGTLPVVARTGGLADTVIDANEAALQANCCTGLQFAPVTAANLGQAIMRACDLYDQPKIWSAMMRRAMRHPVGWDNSAQTYHDLYKQLLKADAK
jgi:starch synthase